MLEQIRAAIERRDHRYTIHAQSRMAERRILDVEIQDAILNDMAEIIEEYPADKYGPSYLIYGVTGAGRVLHVQANPQGVIITVYEPDAAEWIGLKRRRS
jgi:hypothetical protein